MEQVAQRRKFKDIDFTSKLEDVEKKVKCKLEIAQINREKHLSNMYQSRTSLKYSSHNND